MGDTDIILAHLAVILAMVNKHLTGKCLHTYLIEGVQQRTSMCVSLSDREKKGGKGNEMS